MLRYIDFGLSHMEVPGEASICIYITGCPNRCPECHYRVLQLQDSGELLGKNLDTILAFYSPIASCVCFLGEGTAGDADRDELIDYAEKVHDLKLKCCLYSGRDTEIEDWMQVFDYVKVGRYRKDCGPISSPNTNQRMYKKTNEGYTDMTTEFW